MHQKGQATLRRESRHTHTHTHTPTHTHTHTHTHTDTHTSSHLYTVAYIYTPSWHKQAQTLITTHTQTLPVTCSSRGVCEYVRGRQTPEAGRTLTKQCVAGKSDNLVCQ